MTQDFILKAQHQVAYWSMISFKCHKIMLINAHIKTESFQGEPLQQMNLKNQACRYTS